MKTQYVLLNFGRTFFKEPLQKGDIIKNVIVDGVLKEICILEKLNIPDLDQETKKLTEGQFFEGAICQDCDLPLPKLKDKGGWGVVECPNYHRMFNTNNYRFAGGIFHTGTGCKCETCLELESN